ncbi:MAG: four helix bundle protein [Bacteroidales bacterium]|jgi:four helix bundle protein|nr:four helix bundle protein [Bacteroidales bacterium]
MENPLYTKSKRLALDIIQLNKYLVEKKEYTMSNQVLRSGTSVGANIREGKRPQSDADLISKWSIALKEAEETQYWLELLFESGYINENMFIKLNTQTEEIIKILVTVIRNKKKQS